MYRTPRVVTIGGQGKTKRIAIGGNAPVTVQTMWKEGIIGVKDDSSALSRIIDRMGNMQSLGCDVIRFAVPDMASAESFKEICKYAPVPLIADIHFDYRLALASLEGPVAAIRINPGNIGKRENVEAVVNACKDKGVAIRIGVNSGSLPKDLAEQVADGRMTRALALCEAAAREVAVFDELHFDQVVVSMKASSVQETIEANEAFASKYDIPLHLGVTEAGPLVIGVVKSTMALTHLLRQGIGSTIRVSLSSTPENEICTGVTILKECGLRTGGVQIISCPRCGRIGFDVHGFVDRWQQELLSMKKDITVAVMGCVVNGPGEGKHADIGIAGGDGRAIIFKKGKIVRTVDEKDADTVFREELDSL